MVLAMWAPQGVADGSAPWSVSVAPSSRRLPLGIEAVGDVVPERDDRVLRPRGNDRHQGPQGREEGVGVPRWRSSHSVLGLLLPTCPGQAPWENIEAGSPPLPSTQAAERLDVCLAGLEELPEAAVAVP